MRSFSHPVFGTFLALSISLGLNTSPVSASSPSTSSAQNEKSDKVRWNNWSDEIFAQAKKEGKLVLLDLEAVWCHWCHVMDAKTYSEPSIKQLMAKHYIAIKVDQDSRPDLSNKYEKYGWPATIIFNSDGLELAKRSGYIEPIEMKQLLKKLAANPNKPEPDAVAEKVVYTTNTSLSEAQRKDLTSRHVDGYDTEKAGWGRGGHKFLDWDSIEFSLLLARTDLAAAERAKKTLDAHHKLLDPVWGGVYQYSTYGDWDHPHFEKIMQSQAECLRTYALSSMVFNEQRYLKSAESIASYIQNFLLSADGAFYTSQDADLKPGEHSAEYFTLGDAERRAKGMPRIDKHIYSRENGWAINAFAFLYMASGNAEYLKVAEKAADWIIANRSLSDGGFKHDENDQGGPFLGDTLAMARAFLSLYQATGDAKWLAKSEQSADFIAKHFENHHQITTASGGKENLAIGYLTSEARPNTIAAPEPLSEENQLLCRFANLLNQYTGKESHKQMAEIAMRYLSTPEVLNERKVLVAGTLIPDFELLHPPAHFTVVGSKSDAPTKELYLTVLKSPTIYRRVDWLDKNGTPVPNLEVDFPDLGKPAVFMCLGSRCSSPAYQPSDLAKLIERLAK